MWITLVEELFVLSGGGGLYLGGPLKDKIVMFNESQKCEAARYFIMQALNQYHLPYTLIQPHRYSFLSYLLLTHL